MDEDDNGEINADEFVSTCFKLQGAAQRVDTERTEKIWKDFEVMKKEYIKK